MNWLDIVLLVILALGLYQGLKTGLIGAAILVAGAFIGWALAGQLSDDVGAMFEDSLNSDTLVTVVSYAIIISGSIFVAKTIGKILRPALTALTLGLAGMVDKLGGILLGALMGATVAAIVITGLARFAYNFTIPVPDIDLPANIQGGQAGALTDAAKAAAQDALKDGFEIPQVEDKKEFVEDVLAESTIVPYFLDVKNALPDNAFGLIPSDFRASLEILEEAIDALEAP
ncbi:MAG: CvpA family protein [SAR202 cluster bacterium]|nr:CvpA family protein [SAR202 cluster bacterium]HJO81930.1 CvpA family protein [SAR202 cluster bacterium]